MRNRRPKEFTHERWSKLVQLKKLDEHWHLRYSVQNPQVRQKKYVLAHFHGTISYVAPEMTCSLCFQRPPEAIMMVLKLQTLKGIR